MSASEIHEWLTGIGVAATLQANKVKVGDLTLSYLDLSDPATLLGMAPSKGLKSSSKDIYVYSTEWRAKKDHCKSFLESKLGKYSRRVGARKCLLREVAASEAAPFIDAHHIQGSSSISIVRFGLYLGEELVGLVSLGRHSRQTTKNLVVLDRMCFKTGVQVVGGASRLVAAALDWAGKCGYESLISFSNSRWTDGGVYKTLGFVLEEDSRPDYMYVREGAIISKQSQQKRLTGCPANITEFEWATKSGLTRIFDAGKRRWSMEVPAKEGVVLKEPPTLVSRGNYDFEKLGKQFYWSPLALRHLYLLESDPLVEDVALVEVSKIPAYRVSSSCQKKLVSVVSSNYISDDTQTLAVARAQHQASLEGIQHQVWTEKDCGVDPRDLTKWAKDFLHPKVEEAETDPLPAKIKGTPGRIRDTRDRRKAFNPYEAEGKKKCTRCGDVKIFDMFDVRNSSWDGRSAACKFCLYEAEKARNQRKKAQSVVSG